MVILLIFDFTDFSDISKFDGIFIDVLIFPDWNSDFGENFFRFRGFLLDISESDGFFKKQNFEFEFRSKRSGLRIQFRI